jgi:hypothetical protein
MKTIVIVLLACLVAACGGGGDDGTAVPSVTIGTPNCAASGVCT